MSTEIINCECPFPKFVIRDGIQFCRACELPDHYKNGVVSEWSDDDKDETESVESHDDYDDHGVLCHYSRTTGGWDAIEPYCKKCGYTYTECVCKKQIIKKSNVKKIKRKLIIEEDFDITRLKELPQLVVDYCFSFLSTPETPEQRRRLGCPDGILGSEIYKDGVMNTVAMKEYQDAYNRFFTQTKEQQAAWWNRPAVWWATLVKDETFRVWEIKHYPAVAARFQKMSNAHLKKVTEPLQLYAFNGIWSEGNKSKKHWIINFKRIVRSSSAEETRKKMLALIILSSR